MCLFVSDQDTKGPKQDSQHRLSLSIPGGDKNSYII